MCVRDRQCTLTEREKVYSRLALLLIIALRSYVTLRKKKIELFNKAYFVDTVTLNNHFRKTFLFSINSSLNTNIHVKKKRKKKKDCLRWH